MTKDYIKMRQGARVLVERAVIRAANEMFRLFLTSVERRIKELELYFQSNKFRLTSKIYAQVALFRCVERCWNAHARFSIRKLTLNKNNNQR
jgi:hypothetical protein